MGVFILGVQTNMRILDYTRRVSRKTQPTPRVPPAGRCRGRLGAKTRRTGGGGRQSANPHSLRSPRGPGGGLPVPCPALGVRVGTGPWAARLPSPTPPSLRWSELRFGFETGGPPPPHTPLVSVADPALHMPATGPDAARAADPAPRAQAKPWRRYTHKRQTSDDAANPQGDRDASLRRLAEALRRRLLEALRRPQGDAARRDLDSAQPREGARPEARLAVADPWESKRKASKAPLAPLQVPPSPHNPRPGAKMRRSGGRGAAPLPPPPPAPPARPSPS